MAQWASEVLARQVARSEIDLPDNVREGRAMAAAVLRAHAIWTEHPPPESDDLTPTAARMLLTDLYSRVPGLEGFISKAQDLGAKQEELALGEQLGLPRVMLMELQNELNVAFRELELAKPTLPYGFESRGVASLMEVSARLLKIGGPPTESTEGVRGNAPDE